MPFTVSYLTLPLKRPSLSLLILVLWSRSQSLHSLILVVWEVFERHFHARAPEPTRALYDFGLTSSTPNLSFSKERRGFAAPLGRQALPNPNLHCPKVFWMSQI